MSCAKMNGRVATAVRWFSALFCALFAMQSGMAQAPDKITPQQAEEALKPLYCGNCVELGSVVWLKQGLIYEGRIHAPTIRIESATEAHLADRIGVSEATRAKTAHVCIGGNRRVQGVFTLPTPAADSGKEWVQLRLHPDGIDGVCLGSLFPIKVFLETVVAGIFADHLKEFDARMSPEKLEAMVRNRLADALAKDRAQMTDEIKRGVVAQLKGTPGGLTGGGAGGGTDTSAMVCTSGAYSCKGKAPGQCCSCIDHPGVEGTCDARASPQSWRPKAAKP